jgi:hypothetical protein
MSAAKRHVPCIPPDAGHLWPMYGTPFCLSTRSRSPLESSPQSGRYTRKGFFSSVKCDKSVVSSSLNWRGACKSVSRGPLVRRPQSPLPPILVCS